jgi:hypothetical protein
VVGCFGKTGYALSWANRAERLGITAQELCERRKSAKESPLYSFCSGCIAFS